MGNAPIFIRKSITVANGWVKLSDEPLIGNFTLRLASTLFVIRVDGGTGVALNVSNTNFELAGVDLSRIELSTSSGVAVDAYVVGNTRGA